MQRAAIFGMDTQEPRNSTTSKRVMVTINAGLQIATYKILLVGGEHSLMTFERPCIACQEDTIQEWAHCKLIRARP
eukprot:scaffold11103_cov117-Cylindrotheca_fusiformis.AAC.9